MIVHADETYTIFNSHGKPETENKAYIQHFSSLDKLVKKIWKICPLSSGGLRKEEEGDGSVYFFWVDKGDDF